MALTLAVVDLMSRAMEDAIEDDATRFMEIGRCGCAFAVAAWDESMETISFLRCRRCRGVVHPWRLGDLSATIEEGTEQ